MSADPRPIVLEDLDTSSSSYAALFARLEGLCYEAGLNLSNEMVDMCLRHLLYVEQVNSYINLTRITNLDEALILHVLDSLLLLKYLPSSPQLVLDMGTGAGYPGLPFAICLDASVTLLDSVGKKIKADNAFAAALNLRNVEGVHARLEDYALSHPGEFDVVVARALAPLPVLLEYARPLLCDGGTVVLAKGLPSDDEIESSAVVAKRLGYELVQRDDFELPEKLGHRSVFVYQVVRRSSVKLPRQTGEAKRHPLA